MPRVKQPCTLFNISFGAYVNHFVTEWVFKMQRITQKPGSEIIKLNIGLPPTLANDLVSEALEKYISLSRIANGDKIPDISLFLETVLLPQLTVLDLSNLVHLGVRHNEEFESVIISKLPQLLHLVNISLSTHGEEITLPVCTDQILMEIGKHCHKLNYLDISNNSVSFDGVKCLVPHLENVGCPLLQVILIYECNLTLEAVAFLLGELSNLHIIGNKELGLALMILNKQWKNYKNNEERFLKLTHLNNVGTMENQKRPHIYKFNETLSRVVNKLCPYLNKLQIRVSDDDVASFEHFPSLTSVGLTYNVARPSSPGEGTVQFFRLHGLQLTSVAIICNKIYEEYITTLGNHCINLLSLWLRCNSFIPTDETSLRNQNFSRLTSFYFRVGATSKSTCLLPSRVIVSILCNTDKLEKLKIAVRSTSINDQWLSHLLISINTECLKKLLIVLPGENKIMGAIDLSMTSVHMTLHCIPQLQILGNLFVWNVSPEDVRALQLQSSLSNFDLNIYYHTRLIT